ncbi:MAG: beta-lactamase family protein [Deltaproteobacteria bacterium]|nr:beta-lactamase family protein [Deltaproteobacteria bacterium]
MKSRWVRLVLLALFLCVMTLVATFLPRSPVPDGSVVAFGAWADTAMRSFRRAFVLPGASLCLVDNGRVLAPRSYGLADRATERPVDADTVFQAGGVSGAVAAWGAMKLVEQGKLDLDTPLTAYLDPWPLGPGRFPAEEITLRRVLSHTAGLSLGGYQGFGPGRQPQPLADSLLGAADAGGLAVTPQEPAGRTWRYSGGGYALLEYLIEKVSGEDFAVFMRREVLEPLGMDFSGYELTPAMARHLAVSYDQTNAQVEPRTYTARAASGLYTTSRDLAAWLAASLPGPEGQAPGRGVLQPATIEEMFTAQPGTQVPLAVGGGRWGLGLAVQVLSGSWQTMVSDLGTNPPGWYCLVAALPQKKAGLAVLANGAGGDQALSDILCVWAAWAGGGTTPGCRLERNFPTLWPWALPVGLAILALYWWWPRLWRRKS